MNLKIPNQAQMKRRRIALYGFLAGSAFIFLFFVWQMRTNYNPNTAFNKLAADKRLFILVDWHGSFVNCPGKKVDASCQKIGEPSYPLKLPDIYGIQQLISSLPMKPTHVTLSYRFDSSQLRTLQKFSQMMLYMPRMVHLGTSVANDPTLFWKSAPGHNVSFFLAKSAFDQSSELSLVVAIKRLPWFGPADMPIVLGNPTDIFEYARLADKNLLTGNVGRALEFSTRLLVTAMAVMLDHSRAFVYLGAYAFSRALRDFVPFADEMDFKVNAFFEESIFSPINNALACFFLLMFLVNVLGIKTSGRQRWGLFIFCLSEMILARIFAPDNFRMTADLIADGSAAIIGLGLVAWTLKLHVQVKGKLPGLVKKSIVSNLVFRSSLALITAALAFHLYCSINDYFAVNSGYFKDLLDWRQYVLFYTLIVVGLIEVGSTSKNMVLYADKMVEQVNMQRDLEMGRQVQSEMLPIRRKQSMHWSWRTYYFPASHLAGDWFDVREITFKDGNGILVGCLADVTGHGVAAAMMTSTISSHWGLWCNKLEADKRPQTDEQMQQLLHDAVTSVHRGLLALRSNRGATAAIVILDRQCNRLHYATPGHPGIILERQGKMHYLNAQGPRLGGEQANVTIKSEKIETHDVIHLFTDGLVPPREVLSKWLSGIKRSMGGSGSSFAQLAVKGMRQNRKQFRIDRALEDDMTLLTLHAAGSEDRIAANMTNTLESDRAVS